MLTNCLRYNDRHKMKGRVQMQEIESSSLDKEIRTRKFLSSDELLVTLKYIYIYDIQMNKSIYFLH